MDKMNTLLYKIKQPDILPENKDRYEKLLRLHELLKIAKEEWYKTSSDNTTAKLICLADVEVFKHLHLMESNIVRPLNITKKQLSDCFRKPKNVEVNWAEIKSEVLTLLDKLLQ